MPRPKISAKELIADIRAGLDDPDLMKKYALSAQGLQSAFKKLVEVQALKQSEVEKRITSAERTIDIVWKCPACNMPQSNDFKVCPQCGVVVSKFGKAPSLTGDIKEQITKRKSQTPLYRASSGTESVRLPHLICALIGLILLGVLLPKFSNPPARDVPTPSVSQPSRVSSSGPDCYEIGYRSGWCATRRVMGFAPPADCPDKDDGGPEECRGRTVTMDGIDYGRKSALRGAPLQLAFATLDKDRDLMDAVRAGDVKKVEELFGKGANVNAKDADGFTPLMGASVDGSIEKIKILLSKAADINAKNEDGDTALIGASFAGNTDLVALLIQSGADVNAINKDGVSPLFGAAFEGRPDVVKLLLEKGANVNAKESRHGATPLIVAAFQSHKEVAEMLIAKGADINAKDNEGNTALSLASSRGHTSVVEPLKSKGAK